MNQTQRELHMKTQDQLDRHWCDGATAARLLRISRTHIYNLIERGTIVPYKIGVLTVFSIDEIREANQARDLWEGPAR